MYPSITFIGVGNMASAIIRGLLQDGYPAERITGTARSADKRARIEQEMGIRMLSDNGAAVGAAQIVVLCVKPAQIQETILAFKDKIVSSQLYLSVAAGVEIESLQAWLGEVAIVRSMPNTPAQRGVGMAGLVANSLATPEHRKQIAQLFSSVGQYVWLDREESMHAVTALSGSSPAYFFRFLEAMIKAGSAYGLTEGECRQLASYSMLGAAKMALETEESISTLRENITSPNGTTAQALSSFESNKIDTIFEQAMAACVNRSKEMAQLFKAAPEDKG